jgi:hypothetical protein
MLAVCVCVCEDHKSHSFPTENSFIMLYIINQKGCVGR